jgi:hypothetical protein
MSDAEIVTSKANTIELTGESTAGLKDRLAGLLARTADDLREMAAIVAELEARGEDLSALRLGIVDHLRRIAAGHLLPEIVVHCSGFPALLRTASHLPVADQRKLISGEPLDMAVWRGDEIAWRKVDPLCLTRDQLSTVFSTDRIRSKQEQVSLLEDRKQKPGKPARPAKRKVKADPERIGIVVGRSFAPLEDVLAALAELRDAEYDDDISGEETVIGGIRLSTAEHQQLKVRAAKSNASIAQLVRRALAAAGLIKGVGLLGLQL